VDMSAAAPPGRTEGLAGSAPGVWGIGTVTLGGCLLLALALRLHRLAAPSPWVDEIASWTFARLAWSDLLGPVAHVETNPPGYYALLKLVIGAAGPGEAVMRLPSAIAGALAVVPVALVGRRTGGPLAGLFAGGLVAVSAMQIHHSQEARGYALLFLALATALWLAGPMLDRAAGMRRWCWRRAVAARGGASSLCSVARASRSCSAISGGCAWPWGWWPIPHPRSHGSSDRTSPVPPG